MYRQEIEFLLMEIVVLYLNKNQKSLNVFQVLVCMILFLSLDPLTTFQEKNQNMVKDQYHQKFIKNDIHICLYEKTK